MFEIHSLKMGELLIPEHGAFLFDPVHVWLVTDGRTRILVDSGMPEIAEVTRRLKVNGAGGGHAGLRRALAAVDVAPEQIDYVISTHLHYDHGCNLDLFEKACVIVQRDELAHAADPAPTHRPFYFKESLIHVMQRRRPKALRVIDGDYRLMDGIEILKTPGHTPGMQVPIVTTARGKAALVSDLGDHYKNWFPADPRATSFPLNYLSDTFLPSSLRTESEWTFIESMRRAKEASDIVVPAHDTRIPLHIPSQWFELPSEPEPPLIHKGDTAG
jgi:glyoxylase-like metal-dependent hydrolase (beta-lactamase superfamily II)